MSAPENKTQSEAVKPQSAPATQVSQPAAMLNQEETQEPAKKESGIAEWYNEMDDQKKTSVIYTAAVGSAMLVCAGAYMLFRRK